MYWQLVIIVSSVFIIVIYIAVPILLFTSLPQKYPLTRRTIQFFVATLNGDTIVVNAELLGTIRGLKEHIFKQVGIHPDDQIMSFAGKHLGDGKTLWVYNIQKESTLHLVICLRGGAYYVSDVC